MIQYYLRRYAHGLSAHRVWFCLVLLPPLVYLLVGWFLPDRCLVKQDVSIAGDAPVALSNSPVDFARMSDFLAQPAEFLEDRLAVRELYTQLHPGSVPEQGGPTLVALVRVLELDMMLTQPSEHLVRISYVGKDSKLGAALVAFYTKRLIRKAEEGTKRSLQRAGRATPPIEPASAGGSTPGVTIVTTMPPPSKEPAKASAPAERRGNLETEVQRAFWRPERLSPLAKVSVLSLLLALLWIGALEAADSSFKSDRQVARYLELPVLGSLPDFHKIARTLKERV